MALSLTAFPFHRSLDYFKERFSAYNEKLGLTKNPILLETMLNKLYELFLRHNTLKRNDSMDFFHYLEVRESFYQQSNQILYYLFIPYLEFLHVVDVAKLVRKQSSRNLFLT